MNSSDKAHAIHVRATERTPRPGLRERVFASSVILGLASAAIVAALERTDPVTALQIFATASVVGGIATWLVPMAINDGGATRFTVEAVPGRLVANGRTWIAASELRAFSTGRLGDGSVSIALAIRGYRSFFIAVDSDRDAELVLRSLGVAEGGAGESIEFSITETWQRGRIELAAYFVAFALPLVVIAFFLGHEALRWTAFAALALALPLAADRLVRPRARYTHPLPTNRIVFGRHHLQVESVTVPYTAITGVRYSDEALSVDLEDGKAITVRAKIKDAQGMTHERLSSEQREHVVAHILAAAQRAKGPPRDSIQTPAALVHRSDDPRGWLGQLDSAATRVGHATYRAEGIAPEELEAIMGDSDRSAMLRVAAARVLMQSEHGERSRERVERVLEALHLEGATPRARIVAGLDPRSEEETIRALAELAELEAGDDADRKREA